MRRRLELSRGAAAPASGRPARSCGRTARPAAPRASLSTPVEYPVETFTPAESERLRQHFTNLDEPVFALVNLPETVKGALFARYSRYPGTLRRLFLDEFADSLPEGGAKWDGDEGKRAADLYERIFVGYGDTLPDDRAAALYNTQCSKRYARGFLLYKLYTYAAAVSKAAQ